MALSLRISDRRYRCSRALSLQSAGRCRFKVLGAVASECWALSLQSAGRCRFRVLGAIASECWALSLQSAERCRFRVLGLSLHRAWRSAAMCWRGFAATCWTFIEEGDAGGEIPRAHRLSDGRDDRDALPARAGRSSRGRLRLHGPAARGAPEAEGLG